MVNSLHYIFCFLPGQTWSNISHAEQKGLHSGGFVKCWCASGYNSNKNLTEVEWDSGDDSRSLRLDAWRHRCFQSNKCVVVFNLPVVLTSMHGIKRTKDVNVYLCLIIVRFSWHNILVKTWIFVPKLLCAKHVFTLEFWLLHCKENK